MIGIKNILLVLIIVSLQCQGKLYQVVSLFRHGARYHINSFYDGNATKIWWGELTAVGMRQHQNLGKLIKKQYIGSLKFLSANFNSSQVQVYSTVVNRTIQSAMSQLYGIYPPSTGPKLTYVDRSYHIPPYSNKSDIDEQNYALPNAHQPILIKYSSKVIIDRCDKEISEMQKNIIMKRSEYEQNLVTYKPFLNRMADIFKVSRSQMGFENLTYLEDNIVVDEYLGRPLPKQLTSDDIKNIKHLTYWYNSIIWSMNLSRAVNTYKFQKVIDVFDSRIRNPSSYPLKWTFLSAHDSDLISAESDLNITSSTCIEQLYRTGKTSALNCESGPQFASSIIFELHSDDQIIYNVKIRFNGKYINMCEKKDTKCSYTDWKSRIKRLMIADVEGFCGNKLDGVQGYNMDIVQKIQRMAKFRQTEIAIQ